MKITEAIKARRSVRTYTGKSLDSHIEFWDFRRVGTPSKQQF
jgi:hypothetical protein